MISIDLKVLKLWLMKQLEVPLLEINLQTASFEGSTLDHLLVLNESPYLHYK